VLRLDRLRCAPAGPIGLARRAGELLCCTAWDAAGGAGMTLSSGQGRGEHSSLRESVNDRLRQYLVSEG